MFRELVEAAPDATVIVDRGEATDRCHASCCKAIDAALWISR
jgi:hypothetical protein